MKQNTLFLSIIFIFSISFLNAQQAKKNKSDLENGKNKIQNNRFTLKTEKPNVKVSWQVTGIRKDAYAGKHRIKVEELKSDRERGKYLHPKLFGQPKEMGIYYDEEAKERNNLSPERLTNLPEIKNTDEPEDGTRR